MSAGAAFLLAPGLLAAIVAHARVGQPEEVCGLIAGLTMGPSAGAPAQELRVVGRGLELHPGRNVAPDPRVHFILDVDTLARQIEFAGRGLSVSAIYHSHPRGPETPSAEDIAQALYPDAVHIICSLTAQHLGQPGEPVVRGFLISDGTVSEVRLVSIRKNALRQAEGPFFG